MNLYEYYWELVRSIRCSESELVRQMRSEEPQSAYRRNVVPAIIVCVCQRNNIANYVFVIARKMTKIGPRSA